MQTPNTRRSSRPDETREFPHGRAEILKVGGGEVGRLVFQPGWRWSNDVKPIAKTHSCTAPHFQYHVSGRLGIRMDDGTEFIAGPGDITSFPAAMTPGSSVTSRSSWSTGSVPATTPKTESARRLSRRAPGALPRRAAATLGLDRGRCGRGGQRLAALVAQPQHHREQERREAQQPEEPQHGA